ncbi:MAG: hypothetical protein ACRBK7_20520 [Acidimicrobiales bacterium]
MIGTLAAAFGGAAAVGSIIGFIFGIPKSRSTSALAEVADAQVAQELSEEGHTLLTDETFRAGQDDPQQQELVSAFVANNNLADVSDWLTKILLGAGLVQLASLPERLGTLSAFIVGESLDVSPSAAVGMVLLGFANGFIISFMWVSVEGRKQFEKAESRAIKLIGAVERSRATRLRE